MTQKIAILFFSFCLISCAYNKDELPTPGDGGDNGGGGSPPIITYTSHAKAIIDANCVSSCHSGSFPSGGVPLVTYNDCFGKRTRIETRAIIQGTMPTSGPLSQTTKDTLQMWIDQGAL